MKYKILQINLVLFISLLSINPLLAALPGNISDLVESSAPAVVNITSTREVAQRQSNNYGGIPDEMLERFGIPRQYRETPQAKREAVSYGLSLIHI